MEDTRKASKSLNPEEGISLTVRIRVSAFTILITHNIFTQKLPEREGIQNTPPLANTVNQIMDGASIFSDFEVYV